MNPTVLKRTLKIPAVSSGHRGRLHVSQGRTGRDLNTDGQTDASDLHPEHRARIRRAFLPGFFCLFVFTQREKVVIQQREACSGCLGEGSQRIRRSPQQSRRRGRLWRRVALDIQTHQVNEDFRLIRTTTGA